MCETLQSEQQKTNCKCRNNDSDYISIIKANCFKRFCLDYNNKQIIYVSKKDTEGPVFQTLYRDPLKKQHLFHDSDTYVEICITKMKAE